LARKMTISMQKST